MPEPSQVSLKQLKCEGIDPGDQISPFLGWVLLHIGITLLHVAHTLDAGQSWQSFSPPLPAEVPGWALIGRLGQMPISEPSTETTWDLEGGDSASQTTRMETGGEVLPKGNVREALGCGSRCPAHLPWAEDIWIYEPATLSLMATSCGWSITPSLRRADWKCQGVNPQESSQPDE